MIGWLMLLFTVVPLVETWLLIEVGSRIGPLTTVLLLLLDGVFGAWLARREGAAVIRQLFDDLGRGLPPGSHLVEGALVLAGATLLVTPGFFTDVVGIILLFPPTRRWIAPRALAWLLRRFNVRSVNVGPGRPIDPNRAPESRSPMFSHPVPPGGPEA